jgi:hypothetical protein
MIVMTFTIELDTGAPNLLHTACHYPVTDRETQHSSSWAVQATVRPPLPAPH